MMRLDKLFTVKNGLASSNLEIDSIKRKGCIPFIRPASSQQRTIAGWIQRSNIGGKHIYPEKTIFVSTNGEGSHTYAYVSRFEFVPNSDVSVLIPVREMTVHEKIFYAKCITMNRWKFSYGRKPKGERLKQLDLPIAIPSFVNTVNPIPALNQCIDELVKESLETPLAYIQKSNLVPIKELFEISYGSSMELCNLTRDNHGINFVSRTEKNNGISAKVSPTDEVPVEGGGLTVACSGSVLETFLQKEPFYSGFHIFYLKPRTPMPTEVLLYYCACIRANRYRYSYGRQANRTLSDIKIPELDSIPIWVYGAIRRTCSSFRETL